MPKIFLGDLPLKHQKPPKHQWYGKYPSHLWFTTFTSNAEFTLTSVKTLVTEIKGSDSEN